MARVNVAAWRVLFGIVLIAAWWLLAVFVGKNFVPTPPQTLAAAQQIVASGQLPAATLDTLAIFVAGYAAAALVGIPLGLVMGGMRVFGAAIEPTSTRSARCRAWPSSR